MAAVKLAISNDFLLSFAQLPKAQQKKASEFITKFRNNPTAPGINYEKINDAANPDYRSVRIDQVYRGIVCKPQNGNLYMLMWVDKHDDAYDWARRHRCEVNTETGAVQLYEAVHTEVAVSVSTEPLEKREPLLNLRDREYLRLGVPQERLEAVKALTSQEDLEAMQKALPAPVFEALFFLTEGLSLDEVMAEYALPDGDAPVAVGNFEDALQSPQSQRFFRVLDDDAELKQMLEAPLEQWRVFLHPSQRQLVERHWNGPVRVLGGAGTGKTVVAMHRARWLVKHVLQKDERLLFTTFTRNLALDIEANLRKICTPEEMKKIGVLNLDSWVMRFLKREGASLKITYPGNDDYDRCWNKALTMIPGDLGLPDSFYEEEWNRVILPQRVLSQKEYFQASRIGRGVALNRKQRMAIWPVFEEMRLQIHQQGLVTAEDATFIAIDKVEQGAVHRPFRTVVVDEAQDLGEEKLKLLSTLVDVTAQDCMMLVGDGHQRIYQRKGSLSSCGINIRGRGKKLRINYRTSEEIRRFAVSVLEGVNVDDLDGGEDSASGYRSLITGTAPVLDGFDSAEAEAAAVIDRIKSLRDDGLLPNDICVVGRTVREIAGVERALKQAGMESYRISRDSAENTQMAGVRLANMHRVKGLEFKAMFLVGVSAGVVPLEWSANNTEDPTELKARELSERALLHVAATRAMKALYVSWVGEPSRLL